jgi:fimbrial chaperone protein
MDARRMGLVAAAAFILAPARRADAAAFNVKPTMIQLSAKASSGLVSIRNESAETLRFQLSVFAWNQSDKGEMQLQPTQDVVFFPALMSLGPGEERKVRVGTSVPAGPLERSYRIFVEELPPLVKAKEAKDAKDGKTQIRVLTRMGIPIFVEPAALSGGATLTTPGRIEPKSVRGDKLSFEVRNTGNVHFQVRQARVVGLGAGKENLFERAVPGWYVLAGGSRVFEVQPPKGVCGKTKELAFEVDTERTTLQSRLDTHGGTCGP